MKKYLALTLTILLASLPLYAQLANTSASNGSGAPVGACVSGSTYTDSASGFLWTCLSSSWTQSVVPGMILISTSNPTGTGTVSFTSIPGTFKHLYITVMGQGTQSATNTVYSVQLNGDTGSNYDAVDMTFNNNASISGSAVATTKIFCGWVPAATGVANTSSSGSITIYNYANTTFQKTVEATGMVKTSNAAVTGLFITRNNGWWRNTAAINRVDVILTSGNFVSGSQVNLYGIN